MFTGEHIRRVNTVSDGHIFNELPKDETKRKLIGQNYENYDCEAVQNFHTSNLRGRRDLFGNQMRSGS